MHRKGDLQYEASGRTHQAGRRGEGQWGAEGGPLFKPSDGCGIVHGDGEGV